ncbi:MAG: lysine--tRNA ligase [Gammaproteobacteria bacterium]|nr:lysine--tRNA ligase [Gammaproteobacteria bacterium]
MQSDDDRPQDEQEQVAQRREKLAALRARGNAFPTDFRRNVVAGELHAEYASADAEALERDVRRVSVAGRMMTRRLMGKAAFAHLQDMSGQIQLYVQRDTVGLEAFEEFKRWDIGDILGAEGALFRTKTGELSVKVDRVRLLTKALRPLPDKYHGLVDQEARYRQRYLDLIMNDVARRTFRVRSAIVDYIRRFLSERAFLEVETPMMQVIAGGATARPFKTHHNALDIPLYLRIAPELYLKRLVVGGFERVFEINRNFRNEGLSTRHNPEFTMLEFYQAYADYNDLMDLTEEMLRGLSLHVFGATAFTYQGAEFDFGRPFRRLTLPEAILHYNPDITADDLRDPGRLRALLAARGIAAKDDYGLGKLQLELFEQTVESRLHEPTFITSYPTEVSPLARRNDADPDVTDRFELFIGGREIANGFTELNDAEDQAERFRDQLRAREAGDEEAMLFDADYIRALEHGMPPTAGEGIGIDRLVMLFTDSPSIRDVLLFPHMKPE